MHNKLGKWQNNSSSLPTCATKSELSIMVATIGLSIHFKTEFKLKKKIINFVLNTDVYSVWKIYFDIWNCTERLITCIVYFKSLISSRKSKEYLEHVGMWCCVR